VAGAVPTSGVAVSAGGVAVSAGVRCLFPGLMLLACWLCSSGSHARPARAEPPLGMEALVEDTHRIIVAFELDEWFDDDEEYRAVMPVLLESVCRVKPAIRKAALEHLQAMQGPAPERLFDVAGGQLTAEVKDALSLRRQYVALRRAVSEAGDRCPFWVLPEDDFRGRQTTSNQFVLNFEGGGVGQLRVVDHEPSVGGGGNGRLLFGYGLGQHWSFAAGPEAGGSALLERTDRGRLTINYFPAIPVVVRYRRAQWIYGVELGPVAVFESSDTRISYGGRLGGMVGLSVLRTQGFLPWAGIAVDVEHYLPSGPGGREAFQLVRGGFRIGFRWAI
jgi:hypothetical protein